jgi:hypothetical protein
VVKSLYRTVHLNGQSAHAVLLQSPRHVGGQFFEGGTQGRTIVGVFEKGVFGADALAFVAGVHRPVVVAKCPPFEIFREGAPRSMAVR